MKTTMTKTLALIAVLGSVSFAHANTVNVQLNCISNSNGRIGNFYSAYGMLQIDNKKEGDTTGTLTLRYGGSSRGTSQTLKVVGLTVNATGSLGLKDPEESLVMQLVHDQNDPSTAQAVKSMGLEQVVLMAAAKNALGDQDETQNGESELALATKEQISQNDYTSHPMRCSVNVQ